jgi:hypothetical protein
VARAQPKEKAIMELFFKQIDKKLATETVIDRHYLHRECPISWAWGTYVRDDLMGVLTVGKPPSWSTMVGLVGETREMYKRSNSRARSVFELNRLWMDDSLGTNSESRFIGWCLRELRRIKPSIILVSYADTAMGHLGVVYQATNWIYAGMTKPFKDITPDGSRKARTRKHRYVWLANPADRCILKWKGQPYPKRLAYHNLVIV